MMSVANPTPMAEEFFRVIQEEGFAFSREFARRHQEDLFQGVDLRGKRMLDIGGGSGVYSFYAASVGAAEVVCLEPDAAGGAADAARRFRRIREKLPGAPVTLDTRIIQEYASEEPFDVVFMHASVNHLDEAACMRLREDENARESYRRIFTRIGSLAKPGGKLIVVDCARRNFFGDLGLKNPLTPIIEWRKHQQPELWARLLSDAGFRRPKITWEPLYRFGAPGKVLLGNKVAAYFLKSIFRLEMEKS